MSRFIPAGLLIAAILGQLASAGSAGAASTPAVVEGIRIEGNTLTVNPEYWSHHLANGALKISWKKPKPQPVVGFDCTCASGSGCSWRQIPPGDNHYRCEGSCSGGTCGIVAIQGLPAEN
ncbi:MAG: hypothetical protein ABMB14_32590 [Myxococcota bacterium]